MKKLLITLMLVCSFGLAKAQTVGLAWDAVADADLASYVVYRGTAAGTYTFNVDVGNVLTSTQTVPLDCTNYFFAVKAKDTAGNQSTNYSNEISGFARVRLTSSLPATLEQGKSYTLTLSGFNFQTGTITPITGLAFGVPTVVSCNQVTVPVTVAANAPLGAKDLEFVRSGDLVFGIGTGLLTVTADTTAPSVPTNLRRTERH